MQENVNYTLKILPKQQTQKKKTSSDPRTITTTTTTSSSSGSSPQPPFDSEASSSPPSTSNSSSESTCSTTFTAHCRAALSELKFVLRDTRYISRLARRPRRDERREKRGIPLGWREACFQHAAPNPNFKSWSKVHSAIEALKKKAAALEPKFHAWARPTPDFFENTAERKANKTDQKDEDRSRGQEVQDPFPSSDAYLPALQSAPLLTGVCRESFGETNVTIDKLLARKRARARLGKYALKRHDHEADVLLD
ncbi:hypothetical protein TI39_contig556g00002 [Zymoseptoria brevis]|uniref:Uncharacterized protein n=1 Tax=Zymoseptoria brevis TaxID=1047168 RepID=A0A0F4GIM6_9PEZI|nr:hypothetical protein TI39_contig556g00002 [Zymoseptoria brevis]